MTDYDEDHRGLPLLDYDDAVDGAIGEAMPMIRFWYQAIEQFGDLIGDAVREAFADECWDLAIAWADRVENVHAATGVPGIYNAIMDTKIQKDAE